MASRQVADLEKVKQVWGSADESIFSGGVDAVDWTPLRSA
jgi:hypothetical protein